jgi:hypothetical protein
MRPTACPASERVTESSQHISATNGIERRPACIGKRRSKPRFFGETRGLELAKFIGGAVLYDLNIDPSTRGPYAQKVFGFSHISVTSKQMTLRHLDSNGRVLHAFTKTLEGKIKIVA